MVFKTGQSCTVLTDLCRVHGTAGPLLCPNETLKLNELCCLFFFPKQSWYQKINLSPGWMPVTMNHPVGHRGLGLASL